MNKRSSYRAKFLVLLLLAFSGTGISLYCQTNVSGVINRYGRVNAIGPDYVIVNDPDQLVQFKAGDTVLLMQMKGVRIYASESPFFGSAGSSDGMPGTYEFILVRSVDPGLKKILFRNNIVNSTFSTGGDIQIIKVPGYFSARVNATLTCQPWDSSKKTGGVLAAFVDRNLTLNANIDVTGKGFIGGAISIGQGVCGSTDVAKFNRFSYPAASDTSGFKGESLTSRADPGSDNLPPFPAVYPFHARGNGRNFSGGGGGNGKYSGGGGGANYGTGGVGGRENSICIPVYAGGVGGFTVNGTPMDGSLLLGGGGGASTGASSSTPSPGGNGGGIIILVCDSLKGNGMSILAGGAAPSILAKGNAGAGGGGGGGSVGICLQGFSSASALTISANGGKGGDINGTHGEGGGGGAGLITTNILTVPASVTESVTGGAVGSRSGISTGTGGTDGELQTTFVPRLNGFFDNSIYSLKSGTRIDSINSGSVPNPVIGTAPVGGSGSYTFSWVKSYYAAGPWSLIAGAVSKDLNSITPEINNHWIRRVIRDDVTLATDTSKWIKVVVSIPTSTEKTKFRNNLIIYPNPAGDKAEIVLTDQRNGNIRIIISDMAGRKVASFVSQKSAEEFRFNVPVSNLADGIYNIQIILGRRAYFPGRIVVRK